MTDKSKPSVADHYDTVAADYHQMYQRENLEKLDSYPANYFRLQILARRIATLDAKRIYEIGVGEGTPLVALAKMGLEVAGCDISQEMVNAARQNFERAGLSQELIQWGDVEDATTLVGQLNSGKFDAVIAAGVLPHVRNDRLMLETVKMCLKPGGTALIEFRNKLFSLFTFNRRTRDFIIDDLLASVAPTIKDAVAAELDRRCDLSLPPIQAYDRILSKFHNPFELQELFRVCGFEVVTIHWYHYHPAPPMLEKQLVEFRKTAMALEHEGSWRGMFLCSAGVIEARLPG
ncbi:class I SAM-dependent methyltransferase [Dongia deserti]|uniref:class I SAM-dependent methyltransferase n=1 Tax=Dongia deserti TaxID=2268030 RepID=UPI000E65202A|nr:class I SAM-dependent methyltransferase [Dongia deserti]